MLAIGTQKNGTGLGRGISFVEGGTNVFDFDVSYGNYATLAKALVMQVPYINTLNAPLSVLSIVSGGGGGPPVIAAAGGTCAVGTKVGGNAAGTVVLTGICAAGNTLTFTLDVCSK